MGNDDQPKSRHQLAEQALRGYHNGPNAPIAATADADLTAMVRQIGSTASV